MNQTIPDTLHIIQHSPTAIQYTVRNKPLPSSIFLKGLLFIEHILRLALTIWSLVVLLFISHHQWSTWRNGTTNTIQQSPDGTITTTPVSSTSDTRPNTLSTAFSHPTQIHPTYPILALITSYILTLAHRTTIESLLVLHTLGLQTRRIVTSFPMFLLLSQMLRRWVGFDFGLEAGVASATTRFLPTSLVLDVLVHEAFVGWEVRYFLGIVVEGEDKVVVVFERCLPRLDVVEWVWKGCRKGLWMDSGSRGNGRSESKDK